MEEKMDARIGVAGYKLYYTESQGIGNLTVYRGSKKLYSGRGTSLCPSQRITTDDIRYWASVAGVVLTDDEIVARKSIGSPKKEMDWLAARNECI